MSCYFDKCMWNWVISQLITACRDVRYLGLFSEAEPISV